MASQKKTGHVSIDINNKHNPSHAYVVEKYADALPDAKEMQSYKDYTHRGHWLRAAELGSKEAVVHISSILIGVDLTTTDPQAIFISGFAALIAGTFGLAVVEFVTMYTLLDVERAQRQRDKGVTLKDVLIRETERLPNPWQAGIVAGVAYAVGGVIPLVASTFVGSAKLRVPVLIAVASTSLALLGLLGARLGRSSSYVKSCLRVLIGGLMVVGITMGITKVVGVKVH